MIAITYFPSLRNAQGKRQATTWPKLCEWLSKPVIAPVKDEAGGLSIATYAGDRRALANVEAVYCLGIDLDHIDALSVHTVHGAAVVEAHDWTALRRAFNASASFVHTTWSSSLQHPRLRVFFLLSRPVSSEEYRRVYHATARILERGGCVVDRQASDPSRFWFRPSIAAEGRSFVFWTCTGKPLDVEAALAAVPAPAAAAAPPPSGPRVRPTAGVDAYDRAKAYLEKCPGAVSGSGGHAQTFAIAQRMVRGFSLSTDDAYRLLCEWNQRCVPPWSERDLRRKLQQAETQGRMAEGDMLERQR